MNATATLAPTPHPKKLQINWVFLFICLPLIMIVGLGSLLFLIGQNASVTGQATLSSGVSISATAYGFSGVGMSTIDPDTAKIDLAGKKIQIGADGVVVDGTLIASIGNATSVNIIARDGEITFEADGEMLAVVD